MNLQVFLSNLNVISSGIARRFFDIFVASFAIVLLSPFLIAISLAILFNSGRPILFSQIRLGQNGRPFLMYKFRKFHASCDSSGLPLTLENDPRMMKIGRFLQATKLDELPQLYNVIQGKMSLIGPRPETPVFADCFVGRFKRVLDFKPGILGPSQVLFRNESQIYTSSASPEKLYREYLFPIKANIDLDYYRRRTLIGDITWLARGIFAVVWGGQKSNENALLPMRQTPQSEGSHSV